MTAAGEIEGQLSHFPVVSMRLRCASALGLKRVYVQSRWMDILEKTVSLKFMNEFADLFPTNC